MFGNETITIVHVGADKSYSTFKLNKCNVQANRNFSISGKVVNIVDTTMIYSPNNDILDVGDYIIPRNVDIDLSNFNISNFLKEYNPLVVVAVRKQKLFNELEIECK